MKEEEKIHPHTKNTAKEFIDSLFDAQVFKPDITRDEMSGFEDLLAFVMQCERDSNARLAEFSAKWDLKDKSNPS